MKATLFCLLPIIAASMLPAGAATPPTEITVVGTGRVTLPPNVATVSAAVETNAPSATDAVSQNNATYDRVVAALVKLGIARSDISLDYYNVSYNPPPQTPSSNERYGYTVSRGFGIKVRDIARTGSVVDACTESGSTSIGGVRFGIDDPTAARAQAAEKAVSDARARAETLAHAAGLRILSIKSIVTEGAANVAPQPMALRTIARVQTEFEQSNVSVTVEVAVTFVAEP